MALSSLFRSAGLRTQAPIPQPQWKVSRTRKSQQYCYNIPDYKQEDTDRRFYYPMGTFYFSCLDPLAPIQDIIVARYRNRVKCKHSAKDEEFFSIATAARTGVTTKFMQHLATHKTSLQQLPPSPADDLRHRFGFVASCEKPDEKQQVLDILDCLHALVPISDTMRKICSDLMMAPKFEETETLLAFPEDKDMAPAYFKYGRTTLYFGGGNNRSYFEDEAVIRTTIPPLHQAVLRGDLKEIEQRLTNNPHEANMKDPLGVCAFTLAHYSDSEEMALLFLKAKHKVGPTSIGDALTLHNRTIWYLNRKDPNVSKNSGAMQKAFEQYTALSQQPILFRSSLHEACIRGDIEQVQQCLREDKSRIEEQDPRGFTPVLLAAGNGHAQLLRWLFEQGASREAVIFQHPFNGETRYRLIDSAASGEVMQVLLEYRIDPEAFDNNRLIHAINTNKTSLAKFLVYYLRTLPTHKGLNALNLAIHLSPKYGTEMLKMLLMAYDQPVQSGPYDDNIPAAVAELLTAHNKRILSKLNRKLDCAKLIEEAVQDGCIVSWFCTKTLAVKSIIKPLATLSPAEHEQVYHLFDSNFDMVNTADNKQTYFAEQMQHDNKKPGFINLFYDGNKLVAFLVFEIIPDKHADIGEFVLFHGKIAANDSQYSSHGWLALGFRAMTAIQEPRKKVFTYVEAIPPGLGLCGMLPPQIEFCPKFSLPKSFMQQVVRLSGEELKGKKIFTKVKINVRNLDSANLTLDYFKTLTGGDSEKALAVCYEVTPAAITKYLEKVAPNGIGETELKKFAELWQQFLMPQQTHMVRARL